MKTIKVSIGQLKDIGKQLDEYKLELEQKLNQFVKELLDEGISIADQYTGKYAGYIVFSSTVNANGSQVDGTLIATDGQKWYSQNMLEDGTIVTREVSPILMAEFGSGWLANVKSPVQGVGQGTFPNQTHAFDPSGWSWKDVSGRWHHSRGQAPTYPMYNSAEQMREKIQEIATRVFA